MILEIQGGHVDTSIQIPSSKSLSHRALIAAGLTNGTVTLTNVVSNQDTKATQNALSCLSITSENIEDKTIIHGKYPFSYTGQTIDCSESGSTLRFMIPIVGILSEPIHLFGHGRLLERPQDVYAKIFSEQDLFFLQSSEGIKLQGPLKAGKYVVQGNISSQFITGLLMTLPLLDGDSEIKVIEPFESRSYVNLTLEILRIAAIQVKEENSTYYIPGNQRYHMQDYTVSGDDSQMAFFGAKGLLGTTPINVMNIDHHSLQGDHVFIDYVKKMGGKVEEITGGYRYYPSHLKASKLDLKDCPDLGPMLFALAAMSKETTHFIHTSRLRIKESDRITCMKEELEKIGAKIEEGEDEVWITGVDKMQQGITFYGHNDHRIVMALSILASLTNGTKIVGAEAVKKSYPNFFKDLEKSGCKVNYVGE